MSYQGPAIDVHTHVTQISLPPSRPQGAAALRDLCAEANVTRAGVLADLGVRWLKLHPNTQGFDVADPAVSALVERCGALDFTVLFDAYSPTDLAQPGKFLGLAMANPECRTVLTHMFGPNFAEALAYAILAEHYPDERPRVFFDLSAVVPLFAGGPYAEQLAFVIRRVGVEWFLFGSDYPFHTPLQTREALRSLGLSEDEERAILHDNAAALLP